MMHDRRLARARRRARDARRASRHAIARRRGGTPRQDQPERVGQHPLDALDERLERPRRTDAQSVRARSQHERVELGHGGGRRREPRAARRRDRDRRFDHVAGVAQRSRRTEADRRPRQPRRRHSDLAQPGHRGTDDPQRCRCGVAVPRDDGRRSGRCRRRPVRRPSPPVGCCRTTRCAARGSASHVPTCHRSTRSSALFERAVAALRAQGAEIIDDIELPPPIVSRGRAQRAAARTQARPRRLAAGRSRRRRRSGRSPTSSRSTARTPTRDAVVRAGAVRAGRSARRPRQPRLSRGARRMRQGCARPRASTASSSGTASMP